MKKDNKMAYWNICENCGREFQGFIHQTTCWTCIQHYILQINKSLALYENGGKYAVIEWGEKLKLPFDFCEYCDCQVPYIMDQCEKICLVCWSEIDPVIPF